MHSLDAIKKQNNTTAAQERQRLITKHIVQSNGSVWLKHNGITRTLDDKVDIDAFTNSIRGKDEKSVRTIIRSHFTKYPAH
jgi:hypothetical protein